MLSRFSKISLFSCLLASCLLVIPGCGESGGTDETVTASTGSDHDDHDEHGIHTMDEGFEELGECYASIKTAFEGGTPGDAHDALHEVGHALTEMKELAADLPEEKMASAVGAIEALMDAFTTLDGTMHGGGDDVEFADIDAKIGESMEQLKAAAAE
ncbi:MAG: hypothetical protein AB8B50_10700 [Pirellulaceae bacterium]